MSRSNREDCPTLRGTSWLNQIELWFSVPVCKLLKRGSFKSADELKQRRRAFVERFNQALAKPSKWTYKGRPVQA